MKRFKLLPLLLAFAIAFGGCNAKNTTETSGETSEVTTETSETTTEETTEATTTASETTETTEPEGEGLEQVTEFEDLKINDYLSVSRKGSYFIPHFLIEGADFDAANKEIDDWAAELMSDSPDHNFRFALVKADSRRYSLLVYVEYAWEEALNFKAYTFDVQAKEILDNDMILGLAGEPLSEFYDDAYAGLKKVLDDMGATPDNTFEDEYEISLSSERLNKNMVMFLGKNDELILGSQVASMGGASSYRELWDLDGNRYSFGCKVDCINFADDFVEGFYADSRKADSIELFAHRNEDDKKVELYNYVDGELVLIDSLPLDGTRYNTYGPTTFIIDEDGSYIDLMLGQDGKVKSM